MPFRGTIRQVPIECSNPIENPGDDLFKVVEDGIVVRGSKFAFRPGPSDGFSRKEIARVFGVNQFSVKRWEARYPQLANGRRAENERVLRYEPTAIVDVADQRGTRLDIVAVIDVGFPIGIVPFERLGLRNSRGSSGMISVSGRLLASLLQAHKAWSSLQGTSGQGQDGDFFARPKLHAIQMAPDDLLGFAALGSSLVSKASADRVAAAAGCPKRLVLLKAAQAAAIVRDAVRTPEGQGLLNLLLRLRRSRVLETEPGAEEKGAA